MSITSRSLTELALDIIDNRGRTCPTASEGLPLIATNCIKPGSRYPVFEKVRFVDDDTYRTWFRGHPEPGDIIFVCKGSPGRVAVTPDPVSFCIAQDMVAIRANPELVDSQYLYYRLLAPDVQTAIANLHVGSLIPHFKKGDFPRLRFAIHDRLGTQREIAGVLGALDDLIDTNQALIQHLESILSASFEEMARSSAESSSLRPISDLCTVVGGTTPSTKNPVFWDGDICWATPKDLSGLTASPLLSTARRITQAGLDRIGSGLLPVGTVLMSSRAPVGYLAVAEVPTAINQGFIALIPDKGVHKYFLWQWLKANMEQVLTRANGSTFQEVSKANFKPMLVPLPPSSALTRYESFADPLYRQIVQLVRESESLSAVRNELLPLLLSGRVLPTEVAV